MVEPRRRKQADDAPLTGVRVLIVESGYYEDIADMLLEGARRALDAAGAVYDVVTVPGALEIPQAIAIALDDAFGAEAYHGVVALGCVIRGETSHYDIVAGESVRALMDIAVVRLNEILAQFEGHWLGREVEGEQYLPAEAAFFRDIVSGVVDAQRDLDPRIDAALEATWPLKRIEAILRSVLRAGAYELEKRTDIPARVIVSEYVDVAHAFVDKTETGMVNAVLDRLARSARAGEFG